MGLFSKIGKTLFGSEAKTETENLPTLSPDQQAASSELIKFLQSGGNPNSAQGFTGDLVAPLSNLESLSLKALEDRSKAIATTGDPNIRAASEALMQILGRGETDAEDFIETNINKPLTEQFNKNRTATAGRFADSFFGSQRQKQDSTDFESFIDALSREQAGARLGIREQDTDAMLRAIGLAPELAGAETNELLSLLEAGAVPREVKTAQNLGEFERFQDARSRQADLASIISQFLGVQTNENVVTAKGGTKGLIPGFLEAAAGTAGKSAGAKIF